MEFNSRLKDMTTPIRKQQLVLESQQFYLKDLTLSRENSETLANGERVKRFTLYRRKEETEVAGGAGQEILFTPKPRIEKEEDGSRGKKRNDHFRPRS